MAGKQATILDTTDTRLKSDFVISMGGNSGRFHSFRVFNTHILIDLSKETIRYEDA